MEQFKDECKQCWRNDSWLQILTFVAILLIVSSFIIPPTGIIDPSVLAASGELAGFGAIWEFNKAMNKAQEAKIKIKEIELEINRERTNETITETNL